MSVLEEVAAERRRQDAKWGEQNHPDGTGQNVEFPANAATYGAIALAAKSATDQLAAAGLVTFADILTEEVFEALAEHDPAALRRELIQVAAVATQWVEAIDRRAGLPRMSIEELIERSSLGTAEAKAFRESVPKEVAQRIVARANALADVPDDDTPPRFADALMHLLRLAGQDWGPLGVALAAASLTDRGVLVAELTKADPGAATRPTNAPAIERENTLAARVADWGYHAACPIGCDNGACETCPCCSAGFCVMGLDGIPGTDDLPPVSGEAVQVWLDVARECNPVVRTILAAGMLRGDEIPGVGRCGHAITKIIGGRAFCALPAGHAGWHRDENGMEWGCLRQEAPGGWLTPVAAPAEIEAACEVVMHAPHEQDHQREDHVNAEPERVSNVRDRAVTEGRVALERAPWPPCRGQDQHDTLAAREIAETVVDALAAAGLLRDDDRPRALERVDELTRWVNDPHASEWRASTHWDSCGTRHVECLAAAVQDALRDEEPADG